MTFVHPSGSARPARIRILGAAPPPPPPRRGPNRALLAACAVVAALGVGTTLLVRPQMSDDPSPEVISGETIVPMGLLNLGARVPDARALRVMDFDSPDFNSAARVEQARRRVALTPAPNNEPPASSRPMVTTTVPSSTGSPVGTPSTTTSGPDQPPDPASPNTFLDQS